MKILIWIGTLFAVCLLNELLGAAVGFKAGYVVVAILVTAIAKALCKNLDEKKEIEEMEQKNN